MIGSMPTWLMGYRWTDWVELLFGAASVAALIVAIFQIRNAKYAANRAQEAAEAARAAVERTEVYLAQNHLIFAVPQLSRLQADLTDAVREQDLPATVRTLGRWREAANDLRGLLQKYDEHEDLRLRLQKSVLVVNIASDSLVIPDKDVRLETKRARAAIAEACNEAEILAGRLKAYAQEKGAAGDE